MIAVLPVVNLADDPGRDYLAASIGEEITMALSRFRSFAVIARSAATALAGSKSEIYDRAKGSGIAYLVESDIRIAGPTLRLTPRLVDVRSGTQVWADRFEGEISELLAFTDTLTARIVGFVEPEIVRAEIERARRLPPKSASAYDLYLRSLPYFRSTDHEGRARAIALLEDAVRLDPEFATASAHAAWAYERQDTFGGGMTEAERGRALALVQSALREGYSDPLVVAISALVLLNVGGERQRSLLMLGQALEANPFHARILSLHAFANTMVGDLELGRQSFKRALQIAPGALDNYEILTGLGLVSLFKGAFEDAVNWSLRSIALNPDWLGAYWTVVAGYAHIGRLEDANATVAALLAKAPDFRVADIERISRRYSDRTAVMIDGVRLAGLPD